MSYKVVLSQHSFNQINQCVAFVNNVSKEAALKLYKDIMEGVSSLEDMPLRCPVVDYLKLPFGSIRKLIISNGRYALLFRVDKDVVYIDYFVDFRSEQL